MERVSHQCATPYFFPAADKETTRDVEKKFLIDMKTLAARALLNLAAHPDNRLIISKKNGVRPLVSLLSMDSVDAQQTAAGALSNLAMLVPVNSVAFLDAGAVGKLVPLLKSANAGVRQHAAGALANLAVCPGLLEIIFKTEGAIDGLSLCLLSTTAATKENAAEAFANLSKMHKQEIYANRGVMVNLASLMYDADDGVRVMARDALLALGCVVKGKDVFVIREIGGEKKTVFLKFV